MRLLKSQLIHVIKNFLNENKTFKELTAKEQVFVRKTEKAYKNLCNLQNSGFEIRIETMSDGKKMYLVKNTLVKALKYFKSKGCLKPGEDSGVILTIPKAFPSNYSYLESEYIYESLKLDKKLVAFILYDETNLFRKKISDIDALTAHHLATGYNYWPTATEFYNLINWYDGNERDIVFKRTGGLTAFNIVEDIVKYSEEDWDPIHISDSEGNAIMKDIASDDSLTIRRQEKPDSTGEKYDNMRIKGSIPVGFGKTIDIDTSFADPFDPRTYTSFAGLEPIKSSLRTSRGNYNYALNYKENQSTILHKGFEGSGGFYEDYEMIDGKRIAFDKGKPKPTIIDGLVFQDREKGTVKVMRAWSQPWTYLKMDNEIEAANHETDIFIIYQEYTPSNDVYLKRHLSDQNIIDACSKIPALKKRKPEGPSIEYTQSTVSEPFIEDRLGPANIRLNPIEQYTTETGQKGILRTKEQIEATGRSLSDLRIGNFQIQKGGVNYYLVPIDYLNGLPDRELEIMLNPEFDLPNDLDL